MTTHTICNRADDAIFWEQDAALLKHIPGIKKTETLEDVDGSIFVSYLFLKGNINLKMNKQLDEVVLETDSPLESYFAA